MLLRPLPYASPQRLVVITSDFLKRDARDIPVVPGDLKDLRANFAHLVGIAGVHSTRQTLSGDNGNPEQVTVANVTTDLFSLLGVRIAEGRDFAEDDGAPEQGGGADAPPPPLVVILSHEFWQRRFGGDRSILNHSVNLGAGRALVVGVAPAGFELLFAPSHSEERRADAYAALRGDWGTAAQAKADVDAGAWELRGRYQVKETAGMHFRVEPMAADLVKDVKPALLALTWSGVFVLLIACV